MAPSDNLGDLKADPNFLWGAPAIARHLNISTRKFYRIVGRLKGVTKIGAQFVATPESLRTNVPLDQE